MADLAAIREALAEALSVIPDVQVNAYMLGSPTPPCIEVSPGPITYDQAFQRGHDLLEFNVRALVGMQTDIGAQKQLDQFIAPSGPLSVKSAIEAKDSTGRATLGGVVFDAWVRSNAGHRGYEMRVGSVYLGTEWTVQVRAPSQ